MKLTYNSLHYKFWQLCYQEYNETPSNNFCNYFWQLLIGIILLPVSWIGIIFKAIFDNGYSIYTSMLLTLTSYFILFVLGVFGYLIYLEPKICLVVSGLMLGMIGIAYLIQKIVNYFCYDFSTPETIKVIKEGIKSFKERKCPIISWESDKQSTFLGNEKPTTLGHN